VREVGTIIRSLNIFPTEKQLQLWIIQIEEEEPTGFIVYEKLEQLLIRLMTEESTMHKRNTEDEILLAFQTIDQDKKGYLDQDELMNLMTTMGEKFSADEIREMMSAAVDDDGKVHYEDFAELLAAD
jgi:Ca2+-binding EF-hand superfamily protein